jgi:hypothetical protein
VEQEARGLPHVLALSGWARSGKDTVADVLTRYGYERRSFADPLREALHCLDPVIDDTGLVLSAALEKFSDPMSREAWEHVKAGFPEVRRLLQVLGTEVGRGMIGEDIWANLGTRNIGPDSLVVFADCRFPNEAEAVKHLGGEVWRIQRPGNSPANGHCSETALDAYPFDLVLHNTGTRADLTRTVHRFACSR